MIHPSDAELALYAGGDLGWVRQRLIERHVRDCGACQSVAAGFSELRSEGCGFSQYSVESAGGGDAGKYPAGAGGRGMREPATLP